MSRAKGLPLGVLLVCTACGEESLVALPAVRSEYRTVHCPDCGATYLLRTEDPLIGTRPVG